MDYLHPQEQLLRLLALLRVAALDHPGDAVAQLGQGHRGERHDSEAPRVAAVRREVRL